MRGHTIAKASAAVLLTCILSACGGGGGGSPFGSGTSSSSSGGATSSSSSSSGASSSSSSSGGSSGAVVPSVTLLVSPAQLPSAASTVSKGSTITAIVKDANNNLVPNITVAFSASAGAIGPVNDGVTDANGTATAILTTAGDPANQTISVTAKTGTASASIDVPEVGTTLNITGATSVGSGGTATYTVKLADSSGTGLGNQTVSLTSSLGNGISPATQKTDANGQAVFTYTGTTGGNDTLAATASEMISGSAKDLGASANAAVNVSAAKLVFQAPAAATNIPFNTATPVQVVYTLNGVAKSGVTVAFASSRGTLSASSAVTDASGVAQVSIQSNGTDGAGGAVISAQISSGPSISESVQFISTSPSTIAVQASPSTIAPSGTSTISAVVRDAQNNLVFGQIVNFSLSDTTGGSISPSSGTTDQTGTVIATYQATSKTSANNGVQINASIPGAGVSTTSPALITVGGVALRIKLGTTNEVQDHPPPAGSNIATEYDLPWTVIVTDASGNPAPSNTVFRLSMTSTAYQKGQYSNIGGTWEVSPAAVTTLNSATEDTDGFGCKSEDTDNSGVYTVQKDWNHNNKLDPGAVASVPSTLTLDASGSAQFNVTYPKNFGNWVEVTLTVVASVAGTETTESQTFVLPVAVDDVNKANSGIEPPGGINSPFGTASKCSDAS